MPAGGFYAGMVARQRMANKDDEAAAGSDDEEGGLRKKFSNKQAKSAKPVLRQSSEPGGCHRCHSCRCLCHCCRCR
jgi:hypothetical protein